MERTDLFDSEELEHYRNSYCRDGLSKICPLLNIGGSLGYELNNSSNFICSLDGEKYDSRRACLEFKENCGKFKECEKNGTPAQKEQIQRAKALARS